jgi:hypothetical protein
MRPSRPGRGTEIMPIVRDLLERGATQREIAYQAGTSQGHVSQAIRLLHDGPDLAEQVECGQTGLTTAYRLLCERKIRQLNVDSRPPCSHL